MRRHLFFVAIVVSGNGALPNRWLWEETMFSLFSSKKGGDAQASLSALRHQNEHGYFFVKSSVYQTNSNNNVTTIGGPCRVDCTTIDKGLRVCRLDVSQGTGDYYFPYVQVPHGGVGVCIVPASAPHGTLVLTGAMNGCSLQVNRSGAELYFYHDANGVSLRNKLTPGDVVCRVDFSSYAGPGNFATNFALSSGTGVHATYLITVRRGDRWHVYANSFFIYGPPDSDKAVWKPVHLALSRLITTFEA